ncbi:S-adenosyl-L-methionine-dependent methyltransferase [Amylocarpus encephaloides]|uniref:Histone-lysine N-methyltransferase, H3 lysine-79 specific n=1 Tax=Amylocarpus encephaloides TaxID=45428 RepID=A0A9P7YP02_9HELO|nr:S-adenosyl-L-methionine-dependent methyltransferase [Amylocarpus encephaloides]
MRGCQLSSPLNHFPMHTSSTFSTELTFIAPTYSRNNSIHTSLHPPHSFTMNFGGKKSKISARPATIRVIATTVERKTLTPSKQDTIQRIETTRSRVHISTARSPSLSSRSRTATPLSEKNGSVGLKPPRKDIQRRASSAQRVFWDDGDDEEDERQESLSNKKQKVDRRDEDTRRRLRSRKAFSSEEGMAFKMVHAADLVKPAVATASQSKNVDKDLIVEFQYPSASQRERYHLKSGKDVIDSKQEIIDIAKIVTDFYLNDKQAIQFREPNGGFIRQLERAKNMLTNQKKGAPVDQLYKDFKTAVKNYNTAIDRLRDTGALSENLDDKHNPSFDMVRMIMTQCYDRAVSPRVDNLRKNIENKDNTYGELRPKLISHVLREAGLQSDKVFVDLGSGVGNVVLQAALEFGCRSVGFEMMQNACDSAEANKKEFLARCRLWGLAAGLVQFEQGNFLEHPKLYQVLKSANVILVNNQVFTPDLNMALIQHFLDLNDGCKIISLQPFVPPYHTITTSNINDPVNNLIPIEEGVYSGGGIDSEAVSWQAGPVNYYIAEKNSGPVKKFLESPGKN